RLRVTLEVVGEDDVRIVLDPDVARILRGDAVACLHPGAGLAPGRRAAAGVAGARTAGARAAGARAPRARSPCVRASGCGSGGTSLMAARRALSRVTSGAQAHDAENEYANAKSPHFEPPSNGPRKRRSYHRSRALRGEPLCGERPQSAA